MIHTRLLKVEIIFTNLGLSSASAWQFERTKTIICGSDSYLNQVFMAINGAYSIKSSKTYDFIRFKSSLTLNFFHGLICVTIIVPIIEVTSCEIDSTNSITAIIIICVFAPVVHFVVSFIELTLEFNSSGWYLWTGQLWSILVIEGATVLLVTTWCWWLYGSDNLKILVVK